MLMEDNIGPGDVEGINNTEKDGLCTMKKLHMKSKDKTIDIYQYLFIHLTHEICNDILQ